MAAAYDGILSVIVDRFPVSTPDDDVRVNIRKRMRGNDDARLVDAVVERAVKIHQGNRSLYNSVMSGRL